MADVAEGGPALKRSFGIVGAVLVILIAVFFLGPRPEADDTVSFDPSAIPEDIEGWLAASESRIGGITPGAEKEIIWADPQSKAKTPVAVIYLHGFSATKYETRPLSEMVARELGANLFYTRLSGHGQSGEALASASVNDWINDTAEAIAVGKRLGERVLIIGTSTGATLATWALSKPELVDGVEAVAFISPNYAVQGVTIGMLTMPWAETILPMIAGETRSWEPANEAQGKWWTTSYPSKAVICTGALLKLVSKVDKSKIETPALFIYSPDDQVVVPQAAREVAAMWGGPVQLVEVTEASDRSSHVLAGDILSPGTTGRVANDIVSWWNAL